MSFSAAAIVLATGMKLVASHEPGAYADGAPPGFSGGFKEDSCQACHFSETLNAAPGKLAIDGAPEKFAPGERYALTITLAREGMKLAGFQFTARFQNGKQAGSLAPGASDAERVKVENSSDVYYAAQKKAGSTMGEAGVARWVVEWTAPSTGGSVMLNVAANAANGDERVDGDFIYTASLEVPPR